MTRIVTTAYRYKRPPRKKKAAPLASPAVVTPKRMRVLLPDAKELEPASPVVRKAKPCNDNRPDVLPQTKPATVVRPKMPEDNPKPAIVTTTSISDGPPLPMELPLSRKPVERDGDDYKRLKGAMARRLRSE
jgi:hypothetical protein